MIFFIGKRCNQGLHNTFFRYIVWELIGIYYAKTNWFNDY